MSDRLWVRISVLLAVALLASGCSQGARNDPALQIVTGPSVSPGRAFNLTVHPASDRNPSWSPDGSMIAFDSDRGGDWNIYVMNADGSNVRRITTNAFRDRNPSWSPDGARLVFESNRLGTVNLFTIGVQSGDVIRLTDMPYNATDPQWSPAGRHVAFIANDRLALLSPTAAEGVRVRLDDSTEARDGNDGDPQRYRTYTGAPLMLTAAFQVHGPAWSPDGTSLAVHARPAGHDDIILLDTRGGQARRLTTDPGHDFAPCWRDARSIVYASNATESGRAELRVINVDSCESAWLTTGFARATEPDCHPITGRCVFVSDRDGNDDIYVER